MPPSLARKITGYLSANHPIFWAIRIDIALALAAGLWVGYLLIKFLATEISEDYLGSLTQNMRIGPFILVFAVAIAAVLFWFSTVQRAAYREIAPSKQRHPSIMEIFLGTLLITLPGITLSSAMADLGTKVDRTLSGTIYSYLGWCVFPSIVLSSVLFLMLRLPLRTVLSLFAINIVILLIVFGWPGTLLYELFPRFNTSWGPYTLVGADLALVLSIVWLAAAFSVSRSKHVTPRRILFVAMTIEMAPILMLYVWGPILINAVEFIEKLRGFSREEGSWPNTGFWLFYCLSSLLLAEWLAGRWVRMNLAPK